MTGLPTVGARGDTTILEERQSKDTLFRTPLPQEEQARPLYKHVSNQVKRKGGAFQGSKLSQVVTSKPPPQATSNNVRVAARNGVPATNTDLIRETKMSTLPHDVSFDRGFASTHLSMMKRDSGSTESMQKQMT